MGRDAVSVSIEIPVAAARAAPRATLLAAFAAIYLIWGSTYLAIRYALESFPPFFLGGTRFLLAGGVLYIGSRLLGAPRPRREHWKAAALIGGLLLLGGNGGVCWAEQHVPSGAAALLVTTVPVWMVLLHWLRRGGRRPGSAEVLGLILGIAGALILIGPVDVKGAAAVDRMGAVVLVLASLSWSVGSIYSSRVKLPDSPYLATAMEMICGGALLMLLSTARGEPFAFSIGQVTPRSALSVVYLVVFGSLVAFTAYVWLLKVSTPALVSTYAFVNPAVAVLLGCALADEPFTLQIVLAMTLIILGVVLITSAGRSRAG